LRLWLPLSEWWDAAGVWVRYSLGIVGTIITSWSLVSQGRVFAKLGMAHFGRDLAWAALAFALYGIVGQMFVTKSALPPSNFINSDLFLQLFGVPIQLFRGMLATAVAITIIRALRVFEIERAQRLRAAELTAREAERRIQQETAHLNRQLQEAVNELSILFEMSRILAATLDWQAVLQQAVAKVADLLPARAAMILLETEPRGSCAASTGFDDAALAGTAQIIGRAVITANTDPPEMHVLAPMIAVPLQAKRGLIGSLIICVSDVHTFEPKRSLLLTLGRELAIAIENARLYQQVQEREMVRGELLRRSVQVQEEERKRIARELHDGIGQIFTALALGLSGVEETMPRDPALARKQIGNLKDMAIRAISELRQLVADLRPAQLDDLGLVPALHWLTDEWRNRLHLDVRIQITGQRQRLSPEMETVLFRITQEALTNVAKHANAQHTDVKLAFGNDQVELNIEDNGRGMTPEQMNRRQVRHQGWGLAGIQERAALVGGTFSIDSAPGRGTRLTVHIPLRAEEAVT
jgi:signal transduction histidine kinase